MGASNQSVRKRNWNCRNQTIFMYSGNKETFCICNTCFTISVLVPPKLIDVIILAFLVLIIFMFFVNQALKFKYLAERTL
jgi:hypothetical protein